MKSIKEKQILVKWAKAMNEPIDPALVEEVERYNQLQQEIKESIRSNTINDLFDASKVAVDIITKVTVEYPKPPTLEELLSIVQEESNELVQAQAAETSPITEETPASDTPRTETVEEEAPTDLISRAAKHIHKEVKLEENSFQQPQPTPVEKNFNDVQKKLKFLEQAIGKIAATGPGSGEVELKRLDDVDFASVSNATNNQVLAYNAASQLWYAKTGGAGGIGLTDLSVTIDTPSGNGNLTYDNNTGIFNFTPSSGGNTADTLANVTNRGNVTTNGITVNNANVNFLSVNTSAGFSVTTGQIAWNAADLTFDMGMANGVILQVGQEQYIKVKANSTITNGQAVMYAGATGEHLLVVPCDTTAARFIPEWFIGIATQDIATNGFGYITTFGKVHDLNTLAYTVGDLLYVDPVNPGALTNTEPQAPLPIIIVGTVTKRAGGDGHILVRPAWRFDIKHLNDVYTTSPTAGQVLTFQDNIWYNRNITSANVTELSNLYFTNARVYSNVISIGYATNSNVALKANVADLKTANVAEVTNLYFTNARATAAVTNTSLSNVTIAYTPATSIGYGIVVNAANTQGGTGYADFLKVTNTSGGATNPNKSFRLSSAGGLEIINSAYTATLMSLSDAGAMSTALPYQVSGKQAVNGPAFSAYANATLQTITSGSQQKVLFQTEEFDTNSNFANSRFTPTVEGYYQLNAEVRLDGVSGTGEMMIVIWKNGSGYKRGTNQQGTQIAANFWAMQVSSVVYGNGTTDYFEVYVQQGSGGNVTVTAVNDPAITWFNGCMLRGA